MGARGAGGGGQGRGPSWAHPPGRATCRPHPPGRGKQGPPPSPAAINQRWNAAGRPDQARPRQRPGLDHPGLRSGCPRPRPPEAPLSLHCTDGETEAQGGARWPRGGRPRGPCVPRPPPCPVQPELGVGSFLGPDDGLPRAGADWWFQGPPRPPSPELNLKLVLRCGPWADPPQLPSLIISADFLPASTWEPTVGTAGDPLTPGTPENPDRPGLACLCASVSSSAKWGRLSGWGRGSGDVSGCWWGSWGVWGWDHPCRQPPRSGPPTPVRCGRGARALAPTDRPAPPPTPQLYELDGDPKRKEFLDDLFSFMQKRGEARPPGRRGKRARPVRAAVSSPWLEASKRFLTRGWGPAWPGASKWAPLPGTDRPDPLPGC